MRWSIKLGRYGGIDVYVHVTFLLFLVFIGAAYTTSGGSVGAALAGVSFFLAVFGCVLLHEYGHALAARRFGIQTRDITLLPIGGVARLERMPDKPLQELWVALAGPAVNVVIAVVLGLLWLALGNRPSTVELDLTQGSFLLRLILVNVMLVMFNLIPAFPMDGGRVLRALLALGMDYARATRVAATLGQAIALVFALFGLLGLMGGMGNPLLLFIAFFVWIGAGQEAEMVQIRSTMRGARVRDAMLTSYWTLGPDDTLGRAVELVMAGSQQDFPVVYEGEAVGVLSRQRLLSALADRGRGWLVGAAMEREVPVCAADDALEMAMGNPQIKALGAVPVLDGGRVVGLLTWENVTEFVLIQSALKSSARLSGMVPPRLTGS